MSDSNYIAYYRVSTARQGVSGLGLEAQQEAVRQFMSGKDAVLLREFKEVETGKGADAIVVNDVSGEGIGIDADDNAATFLTTSTSIELPAMPKRNLADRILDGIRLPASAHLRKRHYFHARHRSAFLTAATVVGCILVWLILNRMSSRVRGEDAVLLVIAVSYFVFIHVPDGPEWRTRNWFPNWPWALSLPQPPLPRPGPAHTKLTRLSCQPSCSSQLSAG